MATVPLLELQNLAFERDDCPLFEGLSESLGAGDILQISGPNGCGKTTLLHILTTLNSPSHGRILWRGEETRRSSSYLDNLAFIGHQPGLKLALTPLENMAWYARLHKLSEQADLDAVLERMGLNACRDMPCHTLSAGQLRRVALAILHLREASLWLLDEPLTALDQEAVADLESLFKTHLAEGGIIVFSSHQPLSIEGVRNLPLTEYAASVH